MLSNAKVLTGAIEDGERKTVGSFVGMLDGIREKLRAKRSVDKPM